MKSKPKLTIDIVSDVVWPWCFIGKRRLESALRMYQAQAPDEEKPAVRWLPFQLNPDLPDEGITRKEYIERKFGPGGARKYTQVANVGKEVGIDFRFDDIKVQPNTVNAHRLMMYGAKHGHEDEVAESLFRAYFQEGAVLTDKTVLAAIGERAGLERAALETYLASDEDRAAVLQGDLEARQNGVNGVPFFIFNQRTAVSGAHEPEALLQAMLDSQKTWRGATPLHHLIPNPQSWTAKDAKDAKENKGNTKKEPRVNFNTPHVKNNEIESWLFWSFPSRPSRFKT